MGNTEAVKKNIFCQVEYISSKDKKNKHGDNF